MQDNAHVLCVTEYPNPCKELINMSNAEKAVDLLQTGEQTIAEIINLANKTNFVHTDLTIGAPRASADESYNTDIEVTFPIEPTAGNPDPEPVTGELHYNRLDLGRLFQGRSIRIRDTVSPYASVNALIAPLLEEARVGFDTTDFADNAIPASAYPKTVLIKAAPLSLRFVGQFSIELLEPITDDASFVTAPVVTENGTPSQMALKTDGTLFFGEGNLATRMAVASNGEIELAGAVRMLGYNQAIQSKDDVYHVNIGDSADWTMPFSFALLDKRNGDRITDLYNCSIKVTAPGGGVLNFELKRQYGRLLLVDSANQLKIENPAAYNDAQTLFQELQRVTFYKSKLGTLSLNAAGAPYGTFQIELRAVRKVGAVDPVVVSYTAEIAGLPVE